MESGIRLGWSNRGRGRGGDPSDALRAESEVSVMRAHCVVGQDLRTTAEAPSCRYCTN
jgi:hypothetical protein